MQLLFLCFLLFVAAEAVGELGSSSVTNRQQDTAELFEAVRSDNIVSLQEMLDGQLAQVASMRNASGWTALHVAAFYGAEKVAEYLLERGADLSDRNLLGETALHLASLNNQASIVQQLIAAAKNRKINMTAILEAEQVEGRTPVFYAVKASSGIVDLLMAEEVDLFHADIYGMLPIHFAVISRNLGVTYGLLRKMGNDAVVRRGCHDFGKTISHLIAQYDFVEFAKEASFGVFNDSEVDSLGQTPSCWAAINGSTEVAKYMLANSMDILAGNCVYGSESNKVTGSPLHAAAFHRQKQYAELLLNSGADAILRDATGGTAVHALARQATITADEENDIKEILTLFSKNNVRIFQSRDNRGRTPFLIAAESSALQFAKILRAEFFAGDTTAVDDDGYSALHLTSTVEFLDFLLSLPRVFTDIDARTVSFKGTTSAHRAGNLTVLLAAVKQKKPIAFISYLLGLNADKAAVNDFGQTAVHLAVGENYLDAVDLFADSSFNFSTTDNKGRTPLLYAIELERTEAAVKIITSFSNSTMLMKRLEDSLDTPLHLSAMKASATEIVRHLVKDPHVSASAVNANNETPLHKAVAYLNVEAVKLLLENGGTSSLLIGEYHGRTPIHLAATWCNSAGIEITRLILTATANGWNLLDVSDYNGNTPLEVAIKHNCLEMVDLMTTSAQFVSGGCQRPNSQGLTPWHLAKTLGHDLLADMIVEKGGCPKGKTFRQAGSVLERPVDCEELIRRHPKLSSGIYTIFPYGRQPIVVYCNMTYLGGGWTVIQRRVNGNQDFFLKWADYKKGFGDLTSNFWLGNENIHWITGPSKHEYNLLVVLKANDGQTGYALYDGFRIESEAQRYTLRLRSFKASGNGIGDSLLQHKDTNFSSVDSDATWRSCCSTCKGGWWYKSDSYCHFSNLNGMYGSRVFEEGLNWHAWRGSSESMKTTTLMVRRSPLSEQ